MNDEISRCEDCEHFSFGVCDIYGFRYEHDWVCKEKVKRSVDKTRYKHRHE